MSVIFQKYDRLVFVFNPIYAFLLELFDFLGVLQLILAFCDRFWPEDSNKRILPKCEVAQPLGKIYVRINFNAISDNITSSIP